MKTTDSLLSSSATSQHVVLNMISSALEELLALGKTSFEIDLYRRVIPHMSDDEQRTLLAQLDAERDYLREGFGSMAS